MFNASNHKFLLKFTNGTTVGDYNKHSIPDKVIKFTSFADIIFGKWQKNLLIDVIGMVDEVGYSQPQSGREKPRVNLNLKDLGFKIEIEVVQHGSHEMFIFWDRKASEHLGVAASQLRSIVIEDLEASSKHNPEPLNPTTSVKRLAIKGDIHVCIVPLLSPLLHFRVL
ncbi:hypothetical protein KIW84_076357 [Lathyrus oleraceus]|uniref:Uncharacterized protein n=1 Tax=Pisum sativum TaxID=3888 RepID=A0A9D4VXU9_PEA|nr:hypothetical protein KIW84_076357 [Pisum sativum]